jgi:two-component system, LytTR family, sensor kinase
MKIRWRQHELILITILAAAQMVIVLVDYYHADVELIRELTERFHQALLPFNYGLNMALPQLGSILLFYCVYLVINLLMVPLANTVSFSDIEKFISLTVLKLFGYILALSFMLAIGANSFCYLGRPDFFSYAGYGLLAKLGYNDQPLSDIFFGFQRALGLVLLIFIFAMLREWCISRIEKDGKKSHYHILITNNITLITLVYLLVLVFINPMHSEFVAAVLIGAAFLLFYLYTTFWLFPFKADRSFLSRPVLIRVLLSSLLCCLPFAPFLRDGWPVYMVISWAAVVFIATPISWLLYQVRKDQILALRGMQQQLASSTADLQLLRAQINPHFLFNALNTLYGTALMEKADLTATGIQKLGDMMRFVLHDNNKDFIAMQKEIGYLRNYIDLQQLRLQTSPSITIEHNIEDAVCTQQIAPMLLIPLVENAFKHGISLQEKSWIKINLECSENTIYFEVKNSLHKNLAEADGLAHSGIGLANVKERLNLVYANRHELYLHQNASEFIARLLIKSPATK